MIAPCCNLEWALFDDSDTFLQENVKKKIQH